MRPSARVSQGSTRSAPARRARRARDPPEPTHTSTPSKHEEDKRVEAPVHLDVVRQGSGGQSPDEQQAHESRLHRGDDNWPLLLRNADLAPRARPSGPRVLWGPLRG